MSLSDPRRNPVSLPRRRALACAAAVLAGALPSMLLGGCFRPVLAADSPSAGLIGRVRLPEFDDRFGYYLDTALAERLGSGVAPGRPVDYRLEVETRIESRGLAIAQDSSVTRIRLTAIADWALYPAAETRPVLNDRTVSQSGYSSTASLFATRAAKLDVERRLARDLGERIARSILARAEIVAVGS